LNLGEKTMTLTTAQKLAQFEAAQKEAIAREEALREEIAKIQKQQEANRAQIEELRKRQAIINATVNGLTSLDDELFNEVIAIATASRNFETKEDPASQPVPEKIPSYLIEAIKEGLIPYCLGISETLENAMLLEDYDNPDIDSPGTIFWKNNQINPSQNLLNWLESQHHEWEEMKAEIEKAISQKTGKTTQPESEPEIYEMPFKQLGNNNIFIQINEEEPLSGKFKQYADMPRHYEVLKNESEIILEVATTNGSKVRSNWKSFPAKYRTATRLILKHYTETPELMARFQERYPDEAEQAKKDIGADGIYPPGYSEENPIGKGKAPNFQMKRG
jgi:hypothetical protein